MARGNEWYYPGETKFPEMEGPNVKPGNHMVKFDTYISEELGMIYTEDIQGSDYGWYCPSPVYAVGPYHLEPGDSVKVVFGQVVNGISREKAFEIGTAWMHQTLDETDLPPGVSMKGNGFADNLPETFELAVENGVNQYVESEGDTISKLCNVVKDSWVATGRDSLMQSALNAIKAYNGGTYMIPEDAPNAPDLEVESGTDFIKVKFGYFATGGKPADLAGYRVYRLMGNEMPYIAEDKEELRALSELVYETTSTENEVVYEDDGVTRGYSYYYIVTAVDDQGVESSKYINRTNKGAMLSKPGASNLDNVKIVPNPWNLGSRSLMYDSMYKLQFFNLPEKCTIKIYSESLDLVKKIDHDGSGDEVWAPVDIQYMATKSDQRLVSGIYIVHFTDEETGDTNVKKLVIIR